VLEESSKHEPKIIIKTRKNIMQNCIILYVIFSKYYYSLWNPSPGGTSPSAALILQSSGGRYLEFSSM